MSAHYYQALRLARWGGSLALELLRLAVSSGQTALSPDGKTFKALSSVQTALSPDGKTFLSLIPMQSRQKPDIK